MTLTQEHVQQLTAYFEPQEHEFLRGFAYITEGAITTRLDTVDPNWTFEILNTTVRGEQISVHARLCVAGVWRDNVGMAKIMTSGSNEMGEPEKSATTDALKRCARLFGIGRYLLDLPGSVKDTQSITNWLRSQTPQNAPKQAQPDAPATPKGKQAVTAQETPQIGEKRTFEIVRIETELTKDGKPYYNLIATDNTVINTFSRDIFRTWGYTDDVTAIWQKAGHTQDVEIPMPVEAKLVERKDKKGTVWAAIIPEVEF